MNRGMCAVCIMLLAASGAVAQDAIIFTSGQALKGRVLRYDDSQFSVLVSNEVREVYADDVHSIFFGVEDRIIAAESTAPSNPPPAPETVAPEIIVQATNVPEPVVAVTNAKTPASTTKSPPAKKDYGASEGGFTTSEVLARGTQLEGKLIKLEFYSRSVIRESAQLPYAVSLSDGKASLEVEFPKEAYSWFSQLPDRITYSDVMGRNPRAYFLYGIVGKGTQDVYFAGRMVPGVTFQPVGRKTKKGIKGTEYTW